MPRKPRIDYGGAIQHVAVNGNNHQVMFLHDRDRWELLGLLRTTAERYGWHVLAYCLMDTHWHLLVRTPKTLSVGMQRLNSVYSRSFNLRHGRSGHSIRHRFMSVPVETEAHLRELSRYIPLNPVRAGLASHPLDWPWSSYHEQLAPDDSPDWMDAGWSARIHGGVDHFRAYVDAGLLDRAVELTP
ncbi:MAG TPA: transposase [Gaiellales bacterium]|jgi:putative transposase|nr:transposase [Gaiellales bacterium]